MPDATTGFLKRSINPVAKAPPALNPAETTGHSAVPNLISQANCCGPVSIILAGLYKRTPATSAGMRIPNKCGSYAVASTEVYREALAPTLERYLVPPPPKVNSANFPKTAPLTPLNNHSWDPLLSNFPVALSYNILPAAPVTVQRLTNLLGADAMLKPRAPIPVL